MTSIFSFNFLIYAITLIALAIVVNTKRSRIRSERDRLKFQIAWGAIIGGVFYFSLSTPFIFNFFHPPASKEGISTERIIDKEAAQYVSDHDRRIAYLERELKDTQDDLKELNDHYKQNLQLLMYVVIFVGSAQISRLRNRGGTKGDPGLRITE